MRKALPAVIAVLLTLVALTAAQAVNYVPRELPGLGGEAYAKEINNSGQVAGYADCPEDGRLHVAFWNADGTMTDLGIGVLWDLNNQGQVLCSTDLHDVSVWNPDTGWLGLPVFWGNTTPFVMNDAGLFAGWTGIDSDNYPAFAWTADTGLTTIGALPGDALCVPTGTNNAGQVVGISWSLGWGRYLPFQWSASTGMQPLSLLPGGIMGEALSLNESGQVVGYSWANADTSNADFHAVLWNTDGTITDFGTGVAYGINNKGQVICQVNWLTCLRDPDGTLSPLPALPGMEQPFAEGINDDGVVVGQCLDASQMQWRAVIWEPEGAVVTVDLTIDPSVLNPKAKGKWVTAYIELPADVEQTLGDIDTTSVKLQDSVPAAESPTSIGDADGDGTPDLMLKFDRVALCAALGTGTQIVKLTGEFTDGTSLTGECTVRVLAK